MIDNVQWVFASYTNVEHNDGPLPWFSTRTLGVELDSFQLPVAVIGHVDYFRRL
jgi:hypothetical protein